MIHGFFIKQIAVSSQCHLWLFKRKQEQFTPFRKVIVSIFLKKSYKIYSAYFCPTYSDKFIGSFDHLGFFWETRLFHVLMYLRFFVLLISAKTSNHSILVAVNFILQPQSMFFAGRG